MRISFHMLACLLLATGFGPSAHAGTPRASTNTTIFPLYDWGPLFLNDTSVTTNARLRAAGPILEWQEEPAGRTFSAVRPFHSAFYDPDRDRELHDFLWPIGQYRRLEKESFWRFLWIYGRDKDNTGPSKFGVVALPLVFYGRDADGKMYLALFPIGGEIRDFLFFDYIRFALFPLYLSTAVNDVVSHSFLWPIYSRTKGDDVDRLRIFPFYGVSRKKNKATKRFVMWPIWTSVEYEYPNETGGGFVLFPLYGHLKTERQESWMVIPPFIRWSTSPGFRELHCPWPFVQYRVQGDDSKLYLWPLWGTKQLGPVRSSFYLWPIFGTRTVEKALSTEKHFRATPFLHYDSKTEHGGSTGGGVEKEITGEVTERYWKFWPLVSYRRQGDDSRLRLLELWPLKHTAPVERNYAPFWTLYQRESNGESMQEELLWGLYNRRKGPDGSGHVSVFPFFRRDVSPAEKRSSWSLLSGLVGCERESLRRTFKLLYFLRFSTDADGEPTAQRAPAQ
ncbi:MAG: hypothetical protein QGI24_00430 [Kiritimatiellia bacterium]|nr:hypothetical protein [Kiritimatiellia bacterium]MDP6847225.1 hypothetical protein [Kiritimatiellia bacterium]